MKRIALLGLGEVGQGFYEVFEHEKSRVSALTGISMDLGAVLVRNMRKQRKVMPREGLLTDNPHRIINDTTTDAIVDAINDSALGYEMAVSALSHGKHFITANKALVSRHMEELHALAAQHGAAFLYEASVGGGTPLLKPLRALERAGEITSIKGILNGSCNFILTGMRERNTYEVHDAARQRAGVFRGRPAGRRGGLRHPAQAAHLVLRGLWRQRAGAGHPLRGHHPRARSGHRRPGAARV
jgi:homoserine dehydrogenase